MDIGEMRSLSKHNRGNNYYLIWLNAFSKFIQVEPLKKKDAVSVTKATEKMLDNHLKMVKNKEFSLLLVDEGVILIIYLLFRE